MDSDGSARLPMELLRSGKRATGGFTVKTNQISKSRWYWSGLAILLVVVASITPWCNSQIATTTATLSGTITDPSGAIVPGALATLSSAENGLTREFKTDSAGRKAFSQLPP